MPRERANKSSQVKSGGGNSGKFVPTGADHGGPAPLQPSRKRLATSVMKVAILVPTSSRGSTPLPWTHFSICAPLLALHHFSQQNGTVVPQFDELESASGVAVRVLNASGTTAGASEAYREAMTWGATVLLGPQGMLPAMATGDRSSVDHVPTLGWVTKSPELDGDAALPNSSQIDPDVARQARSIRASLLGLGVETYAVLFDDRAPGLAPLATALKDAQELPVAPRPGMTSAYDEVQYLGSKCPLRRQPCDLGQRYDQELLQCIACGYGRAPQP